MLGRLTLRACARALRDRRRSSFLRTTKRSARTFRARCAGSALRGLAARTSHLRSDRASPLAGAPSPLAGSPPMLAPSAGASTGLNAGRSAVARERAILRGRGSFLSFSSVLMLLLPRAYGSLSRPAATGTMPVASGSSLQGAVGPGTTATASISTSAPFGSPATSTVARAGGSVPTNEPYSWFTTAKSPRLFR